MAQRMMMGKRHCTPAVEKSRISLSVIFFYSLLLLMEAGWSMAYKLMIAFI